MSVFRSDDGREIDEADLQTLAITHNSAWPGNKVAKRILAALNPKPRKLTGAELAVAHGIVDGPDGEDWLQAQLRAPDVLERIEEEGYEVVAKVPSEEELAQPAPTCGAVMRAVSLIHSSGKATCILPPGHHPVVYDHNIEAPRCTCGRDLLHENHAPGHMPSADSWVVPNG